MDSIERRSPDTSKVSPDTVEVDTPLGLGPLAPFQWERSVHATGVRVFWGRVVVWVLLFALSGWLALSGGIYAFVKYRRGFTEVKFRQVLSLPFGGEEYRRAKGEFLIRQGLRKVEAQDWRAGLVSVPEHEEARLWVARIYLMAGRPDMTAQVLIDGLALHGGDLDYLRTVLGFFFGVQADATIISFVEGSRGRLQAGTPVFRMANTALAYAYFVSVRLGAT